MTSSPLFQPYPLGPLTLANRIVMAPLTRNRAGAGLVPSPLAATYYAQRASAGLIITEATQISAQAQGYQDTPGLYTQDQIDGWRAVTDAVHARGGRIFVQLWHVGRISHVDLQPGNAAPVSASAIRAQTKTFVHNGFVDVSEPTSAPTPTAAPSRTARACCWRSPPPSPKRSARTAPACAFPRSRPPMPSPR